MRILLSGPNNKRETRTVYADGIEIGRVVPVTHTDHVAWEAQDLLGRSHGDRWLSDWYAAEALERATKERTRRQWEEWKRQANQLDDKELARHASVSTDNRHSCYNCFCCAARELLLERRSQTKGGITIDR